MIRLLIPLIVLLFVLNKEADAQDAINHNFTKLEYQKKCNDYINLAEKNAKKEISKVYIDSALYFYSKASSDTILLRLFLMRARVNMINYKSIKTRNLCKEAKPIIIRLNILEESIKFDVVYAESYYRERKYDSAYYYNDLIYTKVNDYINKTGDSSHFFNYTRANTYFIMGKVNYFKFKFDEALALLYKSQEAFENLNDTDKIAETTLNIGNIFYANRDYDNAYKEYLTSLNYFKKSSKNKTSFTSRIYSNISLIFLARKQYDSALVYINKTIYQKKQRGSNTLSLAGSYTNKAIIYKRTLDFDSTIYYFNKVIEIYKTYNKTTRVIRTKLNLGIAYAQMDKFKKAEEYFIEVLNDSKGRPFDASTIEVYNGLSLVNERKSNFKNAFKYYRIYKHLNDSIYSLKVANKINEYKEKYETEKKDRDISKLTQVTIMQELEAEKQRSLSKKQQIIMVLFGVIAISLVLIIIIIRRNNKLKHISELERIKRIEHENNQKVVDLIKGQEIDSINSFMEGQEKERIRVAAELHDRLGNLLSTVKLHFSSFEPEISNDNDSKKAFRFALDLLDNSVTEVRTISHNLSKGVLIQFGLIGAIKNIRDAINAAGKIQIKYIVIGKPISLIPEREIEIFRIIQEVITNAIKHSLSDSIFIQQINNDSSINITIEDSGVGFNTSEVSNSGIGLGNLKNRAKKINADLNIESIMGQGTTITIEISKIKNNNE